MMLKVSALDWFSSKKSISFDQAETLALLDLLPYPALVVTWPLSYVITGNLQASELAELTRKHLLSFPLARLFAGEQLQALMDNPTYRQPAQLNRLHGPALSVYLELMSPGDQAAWKVLKVEPAEGVNRRQKEREHLSHLERRTTIYLDALQEPDLSQARQRMLQTTLELLEADAIGFYQARGDHPGAALQATYGKGANSLPSEITAFELARMHEHLPTPNRRTIPRLEFQRILRAKGKQGVLATSIGSSQAVSGALLAFRTSEFSPEDLPLLQESAVLLSLIHEQRTLQDNLLLRIEQLTAEVKTHLAVGNHVTDGIVILNEQLIVTDINRSALTSLGYTHQEVIGVRAEDLFISDTLLEPYFSTIRQNPITSTSFNVRLFRRTGGAFQSTLRPFSVAEPGKPGQVMILFQDLTEHEQARQRSEQLEQRALLGEVTASFAHEVRNPINNISTGLQVLEMSLAPEDPNQANISRLQQDCNRLNELIKSGLAFIKPMEYNLERIDLNVLLQNLLDRWQHRLKRDTIRLIYQPDPTPALIEGDPRAVEQIFNNLFTNAVQAMQARTTGAPEGLLGVKIRRVGQVGVNDQIEISVSDTGIGIPEQAREHIFEPFFTTKATGTGLGLAIIKRIVTAHKGSIQVASYPGATVFTVRVPAV